MQVNLWCRLTCGAAPKNVFAANMTGAGAQGWDRKYEVDLYLKQAFCITGNSDKYEVLQKELKVHISGKAVCLPLQHWWHLIDPTNTDHRWM